VILGDTAKEIQINSKKIPSKLTSYTYLNTTINSPTNIFFQICHLYTSMQFLGDPGDVIHKGNTGLHNQFHNNLSSQRLDRREGPGPRPGTAQESTIDYNTPSSNALRNTKGLCGDTG